MDIGIVTGWIALILSGVSLWLSIRADGLTRKLSQALEQARKEESKRVDKLIDDLSRISDRLISVIERQNR